jgi:integration host factor subunit beta
MTRTDLIDTLASRFPGLAAKDSEIAVKLILEAIGDALAQGNRIEVRGFGSFSLSYRPARAGRNPMSGQAVSVPAKFVPHFKAGKELCERVNQSGKLYALRQVPE